MTRRALIYFGLAFATLGVMLAALWLGPTPIASPFAADEATRVIVWEVRLPRSLTAWIVGAALGLSGAALQGLLRNPLADSGVLGLSGFAALGAVLALAFGASALAPLLALAFALVAAALVVALGWAARGPASLALIGVGLSSLAGGLIALVLNLAPNPGAALGLSGAALQGLLRNPLADSGVLGLSGFAALGAVLALALGVSALAPVLALAFALVAAALVVALGWAARGPASLALIGVGLSSLAGGLIALVLNLAPNPGAIADLVNWTLGSVEARSLADAALAGAFLLAGGGLILASARGLQALTLGDEAASVLGADLSRTRALVVLGAAACTGGATAVAGVIGFVGVAAPHLVRALVGHDPARILWPSALAGGALLVLADIAVRLAPTDTELKLGIAAALVGGPVFALIAARLASRGADA